MRRYIEFLTRSDRIFLCDDFEKAIAQILHLAVETAAIQTKPAYAGYKTLDFRLVRVGGLGL
ncbi:MAG: hypothetical protein F6K28_21660 [Microcoleus sp. SIO2G3]|nr:hypothetical protein [Microcoleus sp. SIO2G3]